MGAQLEPNSVYAGVPAKKVKEITPEQRETIVKRTARDYQLYASCPHASPTAHGLCPGRRFSTQP